MYLIFPCGGNENDSAVLGLHLTRSVGQFSGMGDEHESRVPSVGDVQIEPSGLQRLFTNTEPAKVAIPNDDTVMLIFFHFFLIFFFRSFLVFVNFGLLPGPGFSCP